MTAADRPSVTDNARAAIRRAAMDLYRALRRANPDVWAEVDEVEDWTYWDDIVRTAQVTLAAGRAEGGVVNVPEGEGERYGDALIADALRTHARAEAWRRFPDGIDVETGEPVDDYGYPATAREAFIGGAEWAAKNAETTTATTEDAETAIWHDLLDTWGTSASGRRTMSPATARGITRHVINALNERGLLATAPSTATTEDAARVIDVLGRHWWSTQTGETEPWGDLTDAEKANVIENAYIDVLATPVLGLLATARTRPTREAIEEAIEAGKVAHDDAVAAGGAVGPQNDYIAEEVDALLNHDQPTEAEAGARALEDAAADREAGNIANEPYARMYDARWLRERAARIRGGDRDE